MGILKVLSRYWNFMCQNCGEYDICMQSKMVKISANIHNLSKHFLKYEPYIYTTYFILPKNKSYYLF